MTEHSASPDMAASPFDAWLAEDAEVAGLLRAEAGRQSTTLQLIASENFTSPAVLAATGSVLTNKYSEGYPGRRYYGGNRVIDEVEELARERAKALFGAEHANVQPHAGANANLAVYQALLEPGDTVLAMRLDQGGHLTHGSPASITSKIWRFVAYGVTPASDDPDRPGEVIDFDEVADVAKRERPKLIVAGATAYPRLIEPEPFREIADAVGARLMFDIAHPAGLVAGGAHPNPVARGRRGHLHDSQDPAGAPGRRHRVPGRAGQGHRLGRVPRPPGWTARTRHRRQGGGLPGGGPAVVPSVRRRRGGQRPGPGRGSCPRGFPARLRGHRQPPHPGRPADVRRVPDRARRPRRSSTGRVSP